MFQSNVAPFGITGLAACPPEKLEVHHSVNDGIVSAGLPGCNQLCGGIKVFGEPIRRTQSAFAVLGVMSLFVTKHRGVQIQKTRIVIYLRLFSHQTRGPKFGPAAIFVILCIGVQLPELSCPKPSRPEKTLTFFPFAGLVVTVCEKTDPIAVVKVLGVCGRDNRLPFCCRTVNCFAYQLDGLLVSLGGGRRERVCRGGLYSGFSRKD